MKSRTKRLLRSLSKVKEPWYSHYIRNSNYNHPSLQALFIVRHFGRRRDKFEKAFEAFLIDSKNSRKMRFRWCGIKTDWLSESFTLTDPSKMNEALDLLFSLDSKDRNFFYRSYHIIEKTIGYYKSEGAKEAYAYAEANFSQEQKDNSRLYLQAMKGAKPHEDLSLEEFKKDYRNVVEYCDQYRNPIKDMYNRMVAR